MVSWIFIAIILVVIYIIFELMKFKHSIFSIVLIMVLFFFLLSLVFVFNGRDVDLNTFGGIKEATNVYLDWLSLTWTNTKSVTGNAFKMNWRNNESGKPR